MMKGLQVTFLISALCSVLFLITPSSVSAGTGTPPISGTPFNSQSFGSGLCDTNLSGVVSTINSNGNGVPENWGEWKYGYTSCWLFSGSTDFTNNYFAMRSTNPTVDNTLIPTPNNIAPYNYGVQQWYSHPANQVINVGLATLVDNGCNLIPGDPCTTQSNEYQICYVGNCVSGSLSGSRNIVVTSPISGNDFISVSGNNLVVQYVTLGNNSTTPTTTPTLTATPSGTPAPSTVTCGYIVDCPFSAIQGYNTPYVWGMGGAGGHVCHNQSGISAGIYLLLVCQSSSFVDEIPIDTGYTFHTGDGMQLTYWVGGAQGYTGTSSDSIQSTVSFGGHQVAGPTITLSGCTITGTTHNCQYVWTHFLNSTEASEGPINNVAIQTGSNLGNIGVMTPTLILTLSVPANTPTVPTSIPTPTNTPTSTPVNLDGTPQFTPTNTRVIASVTPGGPTHTPTVTATTCTYDSGGDPNFVNPCFPTATVCGNLQTCNSTPHSSCPGVSINMTPPNNLVPNGVANVPLLGGLTTAVLNVVIGGWNLITGLFVPQQITCDFTPMTNAVLTKVSVPNLPTIMAPLQTAMTTPCGYLGVQNIGFNRPNVLTITPGHNPLAPNPTFQVSQPISIGVDGCASPWINYFPLGKSFIDFAMWIWFGASTLLFIKGFFTGKSFGGP